MIEAPRFVAATEDGIIPLHIVPNNCPDLPYYLRKDVLKRIRLEEGAVPESFWHERGRYFEKRIQRIISALPEVQRVDMNGNESHQDLIGHDLSVKLEHGSSLRTVYIQVKSSRWGIKEYKQAIRDSLPIGRRNADEVSKWMTRKRIILINGAEDKSDEEIINDSFYPQLRRILNKRLADSLNKYYLEGSSGQIFPQE